MSALRLQIPVRRVATIDLCDSRSVPHLATIVADQDASVFTRLLRAAP